MSGSRARFFENGRSDACARLSAQAHDEALNQEIVRQINTPRGRRQIWRSTTAARRNRATRCP